jgi:hypothetical protein
MRVNVSDGASFGVCTFRLSHLILIKGGALIPTERTNGRTESMARLLETDQNNMLNIPTEVWLQSGTQKTRPSMPQFRCIEKGRDDPRVHFL